jgi:hypothetical protein
LKKAQDVQQAKLQHQEQTYSSAGYVDFVTDDRNSFYIRLYVGQANVIHHRWENHARCILQRDFDTLHYFILQLGGGHRRANFLQLWETSCDLLPEGTPESFHQLIKNVLEMLFCRAFHSLLGKQLEPYFGLANSESGEYSNIGLNVLSPLLQGQLDVDNARTWSRNDLSAFSRDPEIRVWPAERRRQVREITATALPFEETSYHPPQITTGKIRLQAFQELCAHAATPSPNAESALEYMRSKPDFSLRPALDIRSEVQQHFSRSMSPTFPIGNSAHASIGLIIDQMSIDLDECAGGVPFSLAKLGIHVDNSLIWTYNHTELGLLDAVPNNASYQTCCNFFSWSLIEGSSVKVILLCGKYSENSLKAGFETRKLQSHDIKLRGQTITF